LGYEDSGECEADGFHYRDDNGDAGTWEEEVFVQSVSLR